MREFSHRLRRDMRRAARMIFAERQILLRSGGRMRVVTLGWRGQAVALALCLAAAGWFVYASVARIESGRVIADKEREIGSLKLAFRGLKDDVQRSQTRFTALARTLEAKHAYLVALLGRDSLDPEVQRALGISVGGNDMRARIQATRQELLAQLGRLETVMQGSALSEGRQHRERLDVEQRLHLSAADRARMDHERRHLVARLEQLEDRLAALNQSQRGVVTHLAERAMDKIEKVKSLLLSTGINVDTLLARFNANSGPGMGGPFIAAEPDAGSGSRTMPASLGALDHHLDRLDDIRKLARALPLEAPSDHFYVASGFGKRRDPFNGRWAMHYGLDLAGIFGSPVYATAPGVVVFAGWDGAYGRMVEIDHGMGIHTRYGHLSRVLVKKGQKVELHQKIGKMGTSGRSTGTHVHYEVLVNGQPKDPMKFLEAGDYVLKGL